MALLTLHLLWTMHVTSSRTACRGCDVSHACRTMQHQSVGQDRSHLSQSWRCSTCWVVLHSQTAATAVPARLREQTVRQALHYGLHQTRMLNLQASSATPSLAI